MAILWWHRQEDTVYQVRSAGETRRLYTNGVFHSQYNPRKPVDGSLWDLLFLPTLVVSPSGPRRVLVLGVGGGAVIRQINHFMSPELIVGVDLCAAHLYAAREFFGVTQSNVLLLEADAKDWLAAYQGPAFDYIVDDLFGELEGEAVRAITMDESWSQLLSKHLTPDGVIVVNFESRRSLKSSYWLSVCDQPDSQWAQIWQFTAPRYENHVGVFAQQECSETEFQRRLQRYPVLDRTKASCRLNFTLKPLY